MCFSDSLPDSAYSFYDNMHKIKILRYEKHCMSIYLSSGNTLNTILQQGVSNAQLFID